MSNVELRQQGSTVNGPSVTVVKGTGYDAADSGKAPTVQADGTLAVNATTAVILRGAGNPAAPAPMGTIYQNSTDGSLWFYNGAWVAVAIAV